MKKWLLVLVFIAAGCASQHGTTRPETAAKQFVREVYPFAVTDADGVPYAHPFLGGFNVPRPQFIDIDGDGDLDLFVQEKTGQLMFFENTGDRKQALFAWRTDRYKHLDVGEWTRFFDLDADGDYDLLAEQTFSYIRYYRNDGTPRSPKFTAAVDTLRDAAGEPLFSDRQNIPNLIDIDCDGRLDLFLGQLDGSVTRYESVGLDAQSIPRFRLITRRFEDISIIAQMNGSLHGANTLAFNDIDSDGDQDLFWGDYFEPGLLFIRNTGTCEDPSLRSEPVPFPPEDPFKTSGYNAPFFADIDGDRDEDLFIGVLGGAFNPSRTASENFYFFERRPDGGFLRRETQYLSSIDVGTESIPAFGDLDGDGDLDMLVTNKIDPTDFNSARMYRFENTGSATHPAFALRGIMDLEPAFHYAPTLGDLDADGDLDMLVGSWMRGKMALYRNEGSAREPRFVLENPEYVHLTRGSNATPTLVDIDRDGDLDLFSGEFSGTVNFYRNDGTPQDPTFSLVSDQYLDIDVGQRSFPAFHDLDDDDDFDLILGTEAKGLLVFRNDGTPQMPDFVPDSTFSLPVPTLATPAFVDLDGDGDADFVTGGRSGGLLYYEYRQP